MPTKKTGLGKGFESLIPSSFDRDTVVDGQDRVQKVALEVLTPNPNQPRSVFNETELRGLAESIKQHGIIQPLIATPVKDGKMAIIARESDAGERRDLPDSRRCPL